MSKITVQSQKDNGVSFDYDDNIAIGIPAGGVFTNQAQIRRVDNKYYYEFKPEASRPIMGLDINWCNANIGEDRKIDTTEELFNWLIAVEKLAKESVDLSNYYTKNEIDTTIRTLDSSKVDANKDNQFTIEQKDRIKRNIGLDLGEDPNLDDIKETGFYTYKRSIDNIKYNLIVQTYNTTNQWCVQYQFTANNINRRYYDYTNEYWSKWRTIAVDNYNPNEGYIVTAKAIQNGVKDTNKDGLYVGDRLNGRYVGISDSSLAEMYQEYLDNKLEKIESNVSYYDLRKPQGDPQWEVKENEVWVDNGKIKLPKNGNTGYNDGYGYYFYGQNTPMKITPNVKTKIILEVNSYYAGQIITIESSTKTESISISQNVQTTIDYECDEQGITITAPTTYLYVKYVRFIPIVPIKSGDAASLLFNIKYAPDYSTINIPKGIYNIGNLDDIDIFSLDESKKGKLYLNKNNFKLIGEDRDKTIICGQSIEECGIQRSLVYVTGNYITIENITLSSTYLKSIDGQLPAITIEGKDTVVNNCNIIGGQDTIWLRNYSSLWLNSNIEGTVDFVCGGNLNYLGYFYNCNLNIKSRATDNVICAPIGFITFKNCRINKNDGYEYDMNNHYYLARPWGDGSVVYFINTKFNITCLGYTTMSQGVNFGYYGDEGNKDILMHDIDSFHVINKSSQYYQKIIDKSTIVQQFDDQTRINTYNFN